MQAFPGGPVLMAGANATVLRYDGGRFERLPTPGLAKQTVYGVWGTSGDDFYAVGSAAGRNGFIWHYHGGAFEKETLPLDLPRIADGEVPGFFKVWGTGDDVWVVGAGGAILHRKGSAPFAVVPSGTKDTLFTVHGAGDRLLAVGGASNGVLLERDGERRRLPRRVATRQRGSSRASSRATGTATGRAASAASSTSATGHRPLRDRRPRALRCPRRRRSTRSSSTRRAACGRPAATCSRPALDGGMLLHYGDPVPAGRHRG